MKHIRKVYLDVRTAAASRLTAVRVAASASSDITIAMVADAAATISYTEERKLLLLFFFFIIMTTFKTHTWHKRRSSDKDGDCDSHLLLLFRLRPRFSLPLLCWNTTCLRTSVFSSSYHRGVENRHHHRFKSKYKYSVVVVVVVVV